ncbi:hypothetical protein GGI43DRAFT_378904 [Trichoderma evansii]
MRFEAATGLIYHLRQLDAGIQGPNSATQVYAALYSATVIGPSATHQAQLQRSSRHATGAVEPVPGSDDSLSRLDVRRSGAFVLVNPAGSDKIVRPRLAAPLFSMHTFYQLRLQQQLCRPLLIPLVSSIDSIIKRDQAFALNLASPSAPSLGLAPSLPPRLRLSSAFVHTSFFQPAPSGGFATLINSHLQPFSKPIEAVHG